MSEETCWKCEGAGSIRTNTCVDGRYVFGSKVCDACLGAGYNISIPAEDSGSEDFYIVGN